MGSIILNGDNVTIKEKPPSLLELVAAVEKEHVPTGWIITDVKVAGESIDKFTLEDDSLIPYNPDTTVEISARDPSEVLSRSLDGFESYLTKLIPGVQRISELFKEDQIEQGNKLYIEAFEGIKVMIQLLQGIWMAGDVNLKKLSSTGLGFEDKIVALKEVLERLIEEQTRGNFARIADILESELLKELKVWQKVIPQLRELVDNSLPGVH